MARGGHKKQQDDDVERKCIVTGEVTPVTGLIRFVVGPENTVYPDILGKLPGRGMYVSATRAALEEAGRGQFSRSAKQAVTVPDGLVDEVERQLARHALEMITLARKASRAERVRVLLQASDGSERGKAKLWTPEGARYFGCFTSEELGLAFGRGSVIHCALSTGKLSNRVVEEATKLRGLREIDGGDEPAGKDIEAK